MGTLAGGIAHEFKNLLHAIQGYATFARNAALSPEEQPHQDLDQALKAIDQAAGLTRQLLSFARRESLQFADVDLNRFVEEFVTMLRRLIDPQITFFVDLRRRGRNGACRSRATSASLDEPLPECPGCHAQWWHLVDRHRMPACCHRHDSRSTRPQAGELPPADGPRYRLRDIRGHQGPAVEPFFTTKETGKGTGLGLAMVYGIVKQHQAQSTSRASPEQGSTFEIYLPTPCCGCSNRRVAS